jgi:hypothetical protein
MGCSTPISPTTALASTSCLLPWQHREPHIPLEFEVRIYTNFELSTFDFEPLLSLFRILLNLKLTTDNLKLPKPGNLNRAVDWCHDAGAPGVRSPVWIIV